MTEGFLYGMALLLVFFYLGVYLVAVQLPQTALDEKPKPA